MLYYYLKKVIVKLERVTNKTQACTLIFYSHSKTSFNCYICDFYYWKKFSYELHCFV